MIQRLEKHILAILVNNPGLIYSLNRMLQLYGLSSFQADAMELVEHQTLANLLYEAVEQDSMETAEYISQQTPVEFVEKILEIKESVKLERLTENRQLEDLFRTVLRKRQEQINREINQLRFIQQEAQEQNEPEQDDYIERILQNSQSLARINRALHEPFIPD